jgi:hypothetical protein
MRTDNATGTLAGRKKGREKEKKRKAADMMKPALDTYTISM